MARAATIDGLSNRDEAAVADGTEDQVEAAASGATDAAVAAGGPSPDDLSRPASEADVRRVYLDAASMGYVINGVGPLASFIAVSLALTASEAGVHSVGLAIGLITAGLLTDRLDRGLGTSRVHVVALVVLGLSFLALALAPAYVATLAAACGVGLGFGTMLAHVNQTVTSGGGPLARVRTARGTLIAQISGLALPLVIAAGALIGIGWGLAAAPVLVMVGLSLVFTRGRNYRPLAPASAGGRLPRGYWTAWLFVVVVSAIESTILFWSGSLVELQAGVPLKEATLVVSAFLGGMVVARAVLSLPVVSRLDPIPLMRAGLALMVAASLVTLVIASMELSLGIFLAIGFGSGVMFPLGVSIAMESSPLQPQLASSRLVLAPGLGLLVLPPILGVLADATGVDVAWLLVPSICLVCLGLTIPIARDRRLPTSG